MRLNTDGIGGILPLANVLRSDTRQEIRRSWHTVGIVCETGIRSVAEGQDRIPRSRIWIAKSTSRKRVGPEPPMRGSARGSLLRPLPKPIRLSTFQRRDEVFVGSSLDMIEGRGTVSHRSR